VQVEFQGVKKSYGSTIALDETNLTIPAEGATVLIGPSGCGKSTLLRLVNGLIQPDVGTVLLDEDPLTDENLLDRRRQMGYVIQDGGLFPHLTVGRNISLMASYLGWDDERIKNRIEELTELTRFPADGLQRYPAELSGGQQQRVSLMRGLMLDPSLLLLDEPLGALDPLVRSDLQQDLKEIFRRLRKTVVFVTHDMGEAVYFGDWIIMLREGRVVQQAPPRELLHEPADDFVRDFIRVQRGPLDALREAEQQ